MVDSQEFDELMKQVKNNEIQTLRIRSRMTDKELKALRDLLKNNHSINRLNFSGNEIGPEGAKVLAEVLESNQSIAELVLSYNKIKSKGAIALAQALKKNQRIVELDLRDNMIGPKGGIALAEVLKDNQSITLLNLAHNEIGPEGGKALAEVLKSNQTLSDLNLSNNQLGHEAINALIEVLKSQQAITDLNLNNNKIGPDEVKAIAEVLISKQSIRWLSLSDNKIGSEGIKALIEVLRNNQSITGLFFNGNILSAEEVSTLEGVLKNNHTIIAFDFDGCTSNDKIQKIILRNDSIRESLDEISQTISQLLTNEKSLDVASIEEKLTAYQDQFPNSSIIRLLIAKLNILKLVNADNSEAQFKFFKLALQGIRSSKNIPVTLVPEMADLLEQIILQLSQTTKNVTVIEDQIACYLPQDHPLYLKCQATIVQILFSNLADSSELISKQNDLARCYAIFKNVQQQSPELLKIPEASLFASLMQTFDNKIETVQSNQTMASLKRDHADAFAKATDLVAPLMWSLNPLSAIKFLSHFVTTLPDSTTLSPTEDKVYLAPFKNNKNIYQILYKANDKWRSDRIIYFEDGKLSIHSDEDVAQDNYNWDKPLNEKIEHYFSEVAQYSSSPVSKTPFWSKQEMSRVTSQENVRSTAKKSPHSIESLKPMLIKRLTNFYKFYQDQACFVGSEQENFITDLQSYINLKDDIVLIEYKIQSYKVLNKTIVFDANTDYEKMNRDFNQCLDDLQKLIDEQNQSSLSQKGKY